MRLKKPVTARGFLAVAMFALGFGAVMSLCLILNGGMSLNATDVRRGLVYHGLVLGTNDTQCEAGYELLIIGAQKICTHGPDPAPPGVDVRENREPDEGSPQETAEMHVKGTSVSCTGDGQTGNRIQLIYAYPAGQSSRYATYASSFQQWAVAMNRGIADSAAKTGATSQIRFVHDANCSPIIDQVQLSASGDDSFNNTIYEIYAAGYGRPDRKYLIWMDANIYCGISTFLNDDRPTQDNPNNLQTSWSRVDNGCWGLDNSVELHELIHMLGGVQISAPHSDTAGHCTDEYDRLCYQSAPGATMTYPCSTNHERLLDCNNDDYFSAGAPPPGSYLATHWNTADSRYLTASSSPPSSISSLRHPDGTLIKDAHSQAIYWIQDGNRHRVGHPAIFQSHNLSMSQVKQATAQDLALPLSTDLWFREGTLIKGSGPEIYIVDQTGVGLYNKRHILSPYVFQVLGYGMHEVFTIPDGDLPSSNGFPLGNDTNAHPDGSLVKSQHSPHVYWIDNGQLRRVGNPAVFLSQNINPAKVRLMTAGDNSLTQTSDVYFREGTLLRVNGQPQVYVVDYDNNSILKRHIQSPEVFQGLYYTVSDIFGVENTSELPGMDGTTL